MGQNYEMLKDILSTFQKSQQKVRAINLPKKKDLSEK